MPMQELPSQIPLKTMLMSHGKNGHAMHVYKNEELGLTIVAVREDYDAEWKELVSLDALPDQLFSSVADLRDALKLLT